MKSTIIEMKNPLGGSRADLRWQNKVSKYEDRSTEIIKSKERNRRKINRHSKIYATTSSVQT